MKEGESPRLVAFWNLSCRGDPVGRPRRPTRRLHQDRRGGASPLLFALAELLSQVENSVNYQAKPEINQHSQVETHRLVTRGKGKIRGQRKVEAVAKQNSK